MAHRWSVERLGYAYAVGLVAAALACRWALDPLLGELQAFPTFYVAIAVTAMFVGTRPAVLAIFLGFVVADYCFLPPRGTLVRFHADAARVTECVVYFLVSASLTALAAQMRAAQRVARAEANDARAARAEAESARAAAERAQGAAEAANRAKDEFLATVSHELRTPLSPILVWVRALRDAKLSAEQTQRAYAAIERSARTQAQLIGDLLDVARIVTGKLRLNVHPVMPATVVQEAIEVCRPAADAKGIRLDIAVDPRVGPVLGDAERLQQVVWNLVTNAVKFTPREGRVRVAVAPVDGHVEIVVSDTGRGIDSAFHPHLFERFRQHDVAATRREGGLGLGLAIVRHITEAHGGTVHAESPGVGLGAVFTVTLPLIDARTTSEAERRAPWIGAPPTMPPPRLDGLRVLVVDDEPDAVEALRTFLTSREVEVRVAGSPAQARAQLRGWRADVLVTDVDMPGETGSDLVRSLRHGGDHRADIPAIAVTAYASREDRTRLLSEGFQAHVPKPADPGELLVAIASVVRR